MVCLSLNPAVRAEPAGYAEHAEHAVIQPSCAQQPQLQQHWALYVAADGCCLLLVLQP